MSCFSSSAIAPVDVRIQRDNFVGTALSTLVYGVHLSFFFTILRHYIWPPHPNGRRWRLFVYICVLFTLATIGISLQLSWDMRVFVDNNTCLDCALAFLQQEGRSGLSVALTLTYLSTSWVSDGMLLFRTYMVFTGNKIILILSSAALIALIVVGSCFAKDLACLSTDLWTNAPAGPGLACMTLSLALNIILSTMIIIRLLLFRRRAVRACGPQYGKQLVSVVGILVESASLYAGVAIITIAAVGTHNPMQTTLLPLLGQMQAIPPLLITVRVLEGRDISQETIRQTELSVDGNAHTNSYMSKSTPPAIKDVGSVTPPTPRRSASIGICAHPRQPDVLQPYRVSFDKYASRPSSGGVFGDLETGNNAILPQYPEKILPPS